MAMDYGMTWHCAEASSSHDYLFPAVLRMIRAYAPANPAKILDIGCGNGALTARLARDGYQMIGVDASPEGIELARRADPGVRFELCSVYSLHEHPLAAEQFDMILAFEVIEHLFFPGELFAQSSRLLPSGGALVVSTPYHGYLKNLAISLANGWDNHFTPWYDGGHIKFFSKRTLIRMAAEHGFHCERVIGTGRLPWLWKSMMAVFRKA